MLSGKLAVAAPAPVKSAGSALFRRSTIAVSSASSIYSAASGRALLRIRGVAELLLQHLDRAADAQHGGAHAVGLRFQILQGLLALLVLGAQLLEPLAQSRFHFASYFDFGFADLGLALIISVGYDGVIASRSLNDLALATAASRR